MNFRTAVVLILITLFGFFLRIYQVNSNPPALSWDEASIGYNAYAILKTGKDEHGRFFPLDTFTAFGDYKPPLPVYLTVPFVAFFGLNEFAVRLPSVLAGTLTVFVMFFLVLELFGDSKSVSRFSLLASLLLAISPWHVNLSRAGFEANIALLFVVLGTYFVLAARKRNALYSIAWLPFIAAVYTFNSARYFSVFLIFGLVVYSYRSIRQARNYVLAGAVVAVLVLLPILPHLLSKEARLRFTEVNIFTDSSVVEKSNGRIAADGSTLLSKIIHNRRIGYVRSYFIHFFDHFEPRYLFISGDGNPKFSIQDVGQLYIFEFPFIIIGLYFLFRTNRRLAFFLIFWMVTAIVPAAVARETPHALRTENSLPVWIIIIAYGISNSISYLVSGIWRKTLAVIIVLMYVGGFGYYLHNYYSHYAKEYSGEWQYGYREAIDYAKSVKAKYDTIVLSEVIGRPYIYVLFYEQYDPYLFWRTNDASFDAAGFYNVRGFDKYRFTRGGLGKYKGKTLYILPPEYLPSGILPLHVIRLLDGTIKLVAFEL